MHTKILCSAQFAIIRERKYIDYRHRPSQFHNKHKKKLHRIENADTSKEKPYVTKLKDWVENIINACL